MGLFPAFDDGEKCSKRRKRECEEQPRVRPFSLCHTTNLVMDLEFNHPTDIYSLRPCRNADAPDIVAIGGEHSVEVIQVVRISLLAHIHLTPTSHRRILRAISSRLSTSGRVSLL